MTADDKLTKGGPDLATDSATAVDAALVYATFPSMAEAETVARTVVCERLAACANIIPGLVSIYVWEGRVEREQEVAIVMKTRRALAGALVARMKALHSYTNPAIVVLAVCDGSAEFLAWIAQQTALPQS